MIEVVKIITKMIIIISRTHARKGLSVMASQLPLQSPKNPDYNCSMYKTLCTHNPSTFYIVFQMHVRRTSRVAILCFIYLRQIIEIKDPSLQPHITIHNRKVSETFFHCKMTDKHTQHIIEAFST